MALQSLDETLVHSCSVNVLSEKLDFKLVEREC